MDELIDIVDESGCVTGEVVLKSNAHRLGLWHLCIDIWLYTSSNEILIQKRAGNKDVFPGFWDVSVAGHVGAGESPLNAAHRELKEELGINIKHKDLSYIGYYKTDFKHSEQLIDREFHHVYIAELKETIDDLVLQAEEVSEIKLLPIIKFKNQYFDMMNMEEFVPYSNTYLKMIFLAITDVS